MVSVVSIETHTAQAATCMIANATALTQLPPHALENAVATAGTSDRINTTMAVRRNVRMGFAALLAIAPNTSTAPVVRMAVSRIGNARPSGVNFGVGPKQSYGSNSDDQHGTDRAHDSQRTNPADPGHIDL